MRYRTALAGVAATSLWVCGCSAAGDDAALRSAIACTPMTTNMCSCSDGRSSTETCGADGKHRSACECETALESVPCDVGRVLEAKCWSCHGTMLNATAPMHLVTADDFSLPSPTDASLSVAERVRARIHSETTPMPPPTMPALSADELATLDAWLARGAHAEPSAHCPAPDAEDDGAGAAGTASPSDAGVASRDAGPDVECFEMRAHAPDSDAPFPVPSGTLDLYQCFHFTPRWEGDLQGISFRSLIDQTRVVHHWILYQNITDQTDGRTIPCLGAHPDAAMLAGWAVGGSDTVLPDDVGMQLGTKGFTLEVHYNNDQASVEDTSGVEVCVTKTPRPHLAGTHWLGTTNLALLGAGDVTATCTPNYAQGPITILTSWPHMHRHGTHMKSVIMRANGTEETLIDKPFDFNYQISYPTPQLLNAGDRIRTTCTYGSGPVAFGEGTSQEMCFNFVVAWPAGALQSVGANFTANQCFN